MLLKPNFICGFIRIFHLNVSESFNPFFVPMCVEHNQTVMASLGYFSTENIVHAKIHRSQRFNYSASLNYLRGEHLRL